MHCQHADHKNYKIEGACYQKHCNYNRAGCIICLRDFHNQHQFKMFHEIGQIRLKNYKYILDQLNILDEISAVSLNLKKKLSEFLIDLNQPFEDKNNSELNKEVKMALLVEEIQSLNYTQILQDIKQKLSILNEQAIIIKQNYFPSSTNLIKISLISDTSQQDFDSMKSLNSILFTEKISQATLHNTKEIVESLKFINQVEYIGISNQQNSFCLSDIAFGLILQYQSIFQLMNMDLSKEDYGRWVKLLNCINFQMKTLSYQPGIFHATLITEIPHKVGEIIQVKEFLQLRNEVHNQKIDIELRVLSAKYYLNLFYLLPYQSFIVKNSQQNKIILREIPQPRSSKMILWIAEDPKEELKIIQEIEQKDLQITVMFCTQNTDLKDLFQRYKLLRNLNNDNLRIIVKLEPQSQQLQLFLNTLFEHIQYKEKIYGYISKEGTYINKLNYINKISVISTLTNLKQILSFE